MGEEQPTPPTLHRIWVGSRPLPAASEAYWRMFEHHNPGWEMRTWSERDLANFELARFFPECSKPAMVADLARVEILWLHGGIYVDTDMEPVRSFESLRQYRLAMAKVPSGLLANAVIVSEPQNGGLRNLMDTWLSWPHLPALDASFRTGPYPLTLALAGRPELSVLRQEVFYPWMWNEQRRSPTESTLACHHWNKSWWPAHKRMLDRISLRRSAIQAKLQKFGKNDL